MTTAAERHAAKLARCRECRHDCPDCPEVVREMDERIAQLEADAPAIDPAAVEPGVVTPHRVV